MVIDHGRCILFTDHSHIDKTGYVFDKCHDIILKVVIETQPKNLPSPCIVYFLYIVHSQGNKVMYNHDKDGYSTSCLLTGKKINRVACGSAHSLAWSTNKPVNAGRLPSEIPMEYNQLQGIPIQVRVSCCLSVLIINNVSDAMC